MGDQTTAMPGALAQRTDLGSMTASMRLFCGWLDTMRSKPFWQACVCGRLDIEVFLSEDALLVPLPAGRGFVEGVAASLEAGSVVRKRCVWVSLLFFLQDEGGFSFRQ
jgi:hypothetical protein